MIYQKNAEKNEDPFYPDKKERNVKCQKIVPILPSTNLTFIDITTAERL